MTDIYPGAENTGIVITETAIGDKPLLVYLEDTDSSLWFDLNNWKPITLDPNVVINPLKKGASGDDVLSMQNMLSQLGFLTVTPDGKFGKSTVEAVKKYQKAMGFDVTGIADEATLRAILTMQMPK